MNPNFFHALSESNFKVCANGFGPGLGLDSTSFYSFIVWVARILTQYEIAEHEKHLGT